MLRSGTDTPMPATSNRAFREKASIVMFTSDASARGIDYPNVTGVIQVSYTTDDEYRQRLGRTARAGKWGHGILIIDPVDAPLAAANPAIPAFRKSRPPTPFPTLSRASAIAKGETGATTPKDRKRAFRGWLGSLASRWKSAAGIKNNQFAPGFIGGRG